MTRLLVLCLFLTAAAPLLAGDPAAAKPLYAVCQTCHGPNGEGMQALNAPAIAGQEEWYVKRQLKYFKDGVRGTNPKDIFGMQMKSMVGTLATDKAVDDMAAYVAQMKSVTPASTFEGDAAKGKTLYMLCQTCHGADGKGMQAMNAPNLLIQQDWYLLRQLKNYKEGIRGKDSRDIHGMGMAPMAATLPDEQAMKDIIAYIKTLAK